MNQNTVKSKIVVPHSFTPIEAPWLWKKDLVATIPWRKPPLITIEPKPKIITPRLPSKLPRLVTITTQRPDPRLLAMNNQRYCEEQKQEKPTVVNNCHYQPFLPMSTEPTSQEQRVIIKKSALINKLKTQIEPPVKLSEEAAIKLSQKKQREIKIKELVKQFTKPRNSPKSTPIETMKTSATEQKLPVHKNIIIKKIEIWPAPVKQMTETEIAVLNIPDIQMAEPVNNTENRIEPYILDNNLLKPLTEPTRNTVVEYTTDSTETELHANLTQDLMQELEKVIEEPVTTDKKPKLLETTLNTVATYSHRTELTSVELADLLIAYPDQKSWTPVMRAELRKRKEKNKVGKKLRLSLKGSDGKRLHRIIPDDI